MSTRTVTLEEDEDIYIECNPVTSYGEEIIDNNNNINVKSGVSEAVINDFASNFSNGKITNNVAFQSFIGLGLLAILYGIGNYIFKEFPKKLIQNKLNSIN
tara:strand:- start:517 stop:819 length:303 start_codon:yes stop_codon:yes gene_type:complete